MSRSVSALDSWRVPTIVLLVVEAAVFAGARDAARAVDEEHADRVGAAPSESARCLPDVGVDRDRPPCHRR